VLRQSLLLAHWTHPTPEAQTGRRGKFVKQSEAVVHVSQTFETALQTDLVESVPQADESRHSTHAPVLVEQYGLLGICEQCELSVHLEQVFD
jgi:hypothetical protein